MHHIYKRLKLRLVLTFFLVGFVMTSAPSMAQAATAYGPFQSTFVNGIEYQGRAVATTDLGTQRAWQETRRYSGSAGVGYLGATARLYSSSGALCKSSGVGYNTVVATSFARYTSSPGCYNGPSYARGTSYAYSTSSGSYAPWQPVKSPLISGWGTLSASEATIASVPVAAGMNERGLSYGSALDKSHETEPDLIAVIATNGKIGYSFKTALDEGTNFSSPEQALAWQDSKTKPTIIPVFEADGVTRIGVFEFSPGVEAGK